MQTLCVINLAAVRRLYSTKPNQTKFANPNSWDTKKKIQVHLRLSGVLADQTNTSTYWAVCDGSLGPSPQNHQHFNFLGNNHLILTAVSIKLCSHCLFEVSSGIDRWFGGIVGNQEDVHHISHLGLSESSGSQYRCMCTVRQIKDWAADPESIFIKAEVTP